MKNVEIRPFRPEDGEALADLHRRAILATPDNNYTPEQRESWASGLRPEMYAPAGGGVMEVAVSPEGRPVAFCHYREDQVLGLYVDPHWQRRGIGATLLARAELAIAGSGRPRVRITATLSALPFYESHGYRILERAKHRTRGGMLLDAALLEKPIVTNR